MDQAKPNIVLIMADQWRGDCLSCLGNPVVETPNLDRLFLDGTVFTQAYSAVPSCVAARAALMTGLPQKSHGRTGYEDGVDWNYENTLAGLLSDAGYHTHCVGKMHVYPARSLMGFNSIDLHDGYLYIERDRDKDYSRVDDYFPWLKENLGTFADTIDVGLGPNGYTVRPWPYEERFHPTNWVTSKSIDFLRRRDPRKPFFLKVSYHRPHPPLDPPQYYLDRYLDKELPPVAQGSWSESIVPETRTVESPVPKTECQKDLARRAYYAQITHIDCQINRLIHALGEYNVMDNTVILFLSDHGDMLYDHNMVAKAKAYDASTRIPFMLKMPGKENNNLKKRCDQPVELRDVLPTLLDAAGVEIPDSIEGKSVLPLAKGKDIKWREYVHGEHVWGEGSNHWINTGKELYIWFSQSGEEQYFNLEEAQNNLYEKSASAMDRVEYLRSKLIKELDGREEGYVKDGRLIVGKMPKDVLDKVRKST
jgi:arylsulfatase